MERGADGAMTGYAFPDMLSMSSSIRRPDGVRPHMICSMLICR